MVRTLAAASEFVRSGRAHKGAAISRQLHHPIVGHADVDVARSVYCRPVSLLRPENGSWLRVSEPVANFTIERPSLDCPAEGRIRARRAVVLRFS